jgi:hypothetical protein
MVTVDDNLLEQTVFDRRFTDLMALLGGILARRVRRHVVRLAIPCR